MSVGDYARGDIGTFNKWGLDIAYSSLATGTPGPQLSPSTIFSDNFDSLTNWTETGDGDWRISTSQSQLVPTAPNHEPSNNVLHSDNGLVPSRMRTVPYIHFSDNLGGSLSW